MLLQFIQTCVSGRTALVQHYEDAKTRLAGKSVKKALLSYGWSSFDMFKDYHVKVERLNFNKEKYIVVTHSQINHFYKIV